MYAYRLCNVDYVLKDTENEIMRGSGSLWISPDSIFIKSKKWWYLPSSRIREILVEKNRMKISLNDFLTIEFMTRNGHILNALYHYIEGIKWIQA